MFSTIGKLNCSLDTFERLEIEGDEAHTAIGCYPDMTIIEHRMVTNLVDGTVTAIYVVDYRGSLTAESVRALADKWNLKIVWRRQTFQG